MAIFIRFFHFLGGIQFAITLITLSALLVALGTFLESKTNSHLVAAQWTYANPFFYLLLCLFFVNILFSALRRWPFKLKHVPFLMTHLGLLMIIGGIFIKNQWGIQGNLTVWEGSGNQNLLLPNSFALAIEEKGSPTQTSKTSYINLKSFDPKIYSPFHFPHLKCKIIGYAPHVKEYYDSWVKDSFAYIAGFPAIKMQKWKFDLPLPNPILHLYKFEKKGGLWSLLAINTQHVNHAIQEFYFTTFSLKIVAKNQPTSEKVIPLKEMFKKPFKYSGGELFATLNIPNDVLMDHMASSLHVTWKSDDGYQEKKMVIPLQGPDALLIKSESIDWEEPPFIIDLIASNPSLLIIQDDEENVFLFAFDPYGRIHGEKFNSRNLNTLFSYDRGHEGYGTQMIIPFPRFPSSREEKERAEEKKLVKQLQQMFTSNLPLSPPLALFEKACRLANVEFATTFVEFLTTWHATPGSLFDLKESKSSNVYAMLQRLEWNAISPNDLQASLWTVALFQQLESIVKQGEDPLKFLEKNHWPFISEIKQAMQENHSPLHLLAQQVLALSSYLPELNFPYSLSLSEQARLLSGYLITYGINYRSLYPFRGHGSENFDDLKSYWKEQSTLDDEDMQESIILETVVTHRIVPEHPPVKIEDRCPGLVLEVQQGQEKETITLSYDYTGSGLKWPLLNGKYLIRFQPCVKTLPYRIRLRQARQMTYPQSNQTYSYESDLVISENGKAPLAETLSMNHVYETWDGFRFYLAGVGGLGDFGIKRIQLIVNHDPAKYLLSYPGALLVFAGMIMLFWIFPALSHKS